MQQSRSSIPVPSGRPNHMESTIALRSRFCPRDARAAECRVHGMLAFTTLDVVMWCFKALFGDMRKV